MSFKRINVIYCISIYHSSYPLHTLHHLLHGMNTHEESSSVEVDTSLEGEEGDLLHRLQLEEEQEDNNHHCLYYCRERSYTHIEGWAEEVEPHMENDYITRQSYMCNHHQTMLD